MTAATETETEDGISLHRAVCCPCTCEEELWVTPWFFDRSFAERAAREHNETQHASDVRLVSGWETRPGEPPYRERFACDMPPVGVGYVVVRQEWDLDAEPAERTILEVRLLP